MDEMNFTDTKIVFRSSLRGYNKNDVNLFILNSNKKFANAEKSYIATIRDLRFDIDNAKDELDLLNRHTEELEKKLIDIETERSAAVAELDELKAENAGLIEECTALRRELGEKDVQIDEYKNRSSVSSAEKYEYERKIASLEAELTATKNEAELMRLKGLKEQNTFKPSVTMEQTETVTTELLYKAKAASEEMLRRAEESTAVIMERARNEAVSCRSDMLSATKEIITSVSDELHRSVDICMNDFVRGIRSANNDSSLIADEVKRCGDDFGRRIERLQSDLDRTISEKLSEFDRKHGLFR